MGSSQARATRRGLIGCVTALLLVMVATTAVGAQTDPPPSTPSTSSTSTSAPSTSSTTAPTVPTTTAPTPPPTAAAPTTPTTAASGGTEIVGGVPAPTSAAYPFTAAILLSNVSNPYNAFYCGGTLVGRHWVLTSALCVSRLIPGLPVFPASTFKVVVGQRSLPSIRAADRRTVDAIVRYPNFTTNAANNVALLRLAQPVPASVATPLPMLTTPGVAANGAAVYALGWGALNDAETSYPTVLRRGTMSIFAGPGATSCGSWTGAQYDRLRMLCAGAPFPTGGSVATCFFDEGGPLFMLIGGKRYLVGVASEFSTFAYGGNCVRTDGYVPLFTRVTTYRTWAVNWIKTRP